MYSMSPRSAGKRRVGFPIPYLSHSTTAGGTIADEARLRALANPMDPVRTRVTLDDLEDAYLAVRMGEMIETMGYVCRRTGAIYLRSSELDDDGSPEDVDDATLYAAVPDALELDLGFAAMARDFTAQELPELHDRVDATFRRAGASRRFKELLANEQALDRWYGYEQERTRRALLEWCEQKGFEPVRGDPAANRERPAARGRVGPGEQE